MSNITENTQKNDITIDLRYWAFKLIKYWWLFGLSLVIAYLGGYFYLRYTNFLYSTKAILLVKDAGGENSLTEESILVDEGLLTSGKSLDNEIQILKSIPLMEKAIKRIKGNVSYYRQGVFKDGELYDKSPIILDTFLHNNGQNYGASFYLEVDWSDNFLFKWNLDDEGKTYQFGVPFTNEVGQFLLSKAPGLDYVMPGNYRIEIKDPERVAKSYASRLNISLAGKQLSSSVLELRLMDPVPKKAEDIINTHIQVYDEEEINDKNKVLRNTIKFIDQRLQILTSELDSVEGGIEVFKSNNAIITSDAASSMNFTLNEIRSTVQKNSELEVQRNLLASLENLMLNEQQDYSLIPANLNNDNTALSQFLSQYNEKVLQWERLSKKASKQNPARVALERELDDLRNIILRTIRNLNQDLQIPIDRNNKTLEGLKRKMGTVPGLEKQLIEQIRNQGIKENLFLYLLRRREEAALSAAVTTANTRVIDWARSSGGPVYPVRSLVLMGSLLLGFTLPFLFVIIRTLLETKIESEETVKSLTNIPIMGRIAIAKRKGDLIVKAGNRSAISEMFRLLRTNLNYLNTGKNKPVFLITSSISGEGKTFITVNLGYTLALSEKKVVLIGLDLRKPKLYKFIGEGDNHLGITNYLIGESNVSEIVKQSQENPNLYYIPSGPIPPNPSELLSLGRMKELIEQLKEEYDYILIDTPPIGIVADALLLRKLVTNTLIIVRQGYTRKSMVSQIQEMNGREELTNPYLVLNGIKLGNKYYGYGYGYRYGYYQKD